MTRPHRALAVIAGGKPFFRQVIDTGGPLASLDRLLRGDDDVASIDCVTYACWRHYRPKTAAGLRVLGETPPSPSIPSSPQSHPGADCANPARRGMFEKGCVVVVEP